MQRFEVWVDLLDGNGETYCRTATSEEEARRMARYIVEELETKGDRARVEIVYCRPDIGQTVAAFQVRPDMVPVAA